MESYFCYEIGPGDYAGVLLSDKQHWVRKLPGQLLHNTISHGIARIAEFLRTDSPEVVVHGFVSPLLCAMGENEIVDELRVFICEEQRTTAYFTFRPRCARLFISFASTAPRMDSLWIRTRKP